MPKRDVPPVLQKLLKADVKITNTICSICDRFTSMRSLKTHSYVLEISCHGLPWLAGWIALIWILWKESLFEMQVNFFIGLIIDVIAVGVLKAIFRRRRPSGNKKDMFMAVGPDQYSFPSGHVSRAVFIALFFLYLYPITVIFYPPLLAWTVAVSLSRILQRRHHLLDVIGGAVLGFIEFLFMSIVWLSPGVCAWIVSYISDEKLEGGEYHV